MVVHLHHLVACGTPLVVVPASSVAADAAPVSGRCPACRALPRCCPSSSLEEEKYTPPPPKRVGVYGKSSKESEDFSYTPPLQGGGGVYFSSLHGEAKLQKVGAGGHPPPGGHPPLQSAQALRERQAAPKAAEKAESVAENPQAPKASGGEPAG